MTWLSYIVEEFRHEDQEQESARLTQLSIMLSYAHRSRSDSKTPTIEASILRVDQFPSWFCTPFVTHSKHDRSFDLWDHSC